MYSSPKIRLLFHPFFCRRNLAFREKFYAERPLPHSFPYKVKRRYNGWQLLGTSQVPFPSPITLLFFVLVFVITITEKYSCFLIWSVTPLLFTASWFLQMLFSHFHLHLLICNAFASSQYKLNKFRSPSDGASISIKFLS